MPGTTRSFLQRARQSLWVVGGLIATLWGAGMLALVLPYARLGSEDVISPIVCAAAGVIAVLGIVSIAVGLRRARAPGTPPPVRRQRQAPTIFGVEIGLFSFLGLLLLTVGAVFAVIGWVFLFDDYQFRTEGIATGATVLEKGTTSSDGSIGPISGPRGPGGAAPPRFWVRYRFALPDGREITGRDGDVDPAVWSRLHQRENVEVSYLPRAPGRNRVAPHALGWLIPFVAAIGAIVVATGGWSLVYGLRRDWRKRRARQTRRTAAH